MNNKEKKKKKENKIEKLLLHYTVHTIKSAGCHKYRNHNELEYIKAKAQIHDSKTK